MRNSHLKRIWVVALADYCDGRTDRSNKRYVTHNWGYINKEIKMNKTKRRVWRYKGVIGIRREAGQTTQWPKEKGQNDKQRSTKHYTVNFRHMKLKQFILHVRVGLYITPMGLVALLVQFYCEGISLANSNCACTYFHKF